jgi:hypothetical protein
MPIMITGHVVDRRTDHPAADLHIELRDREALEGRPLATSLEHTNVDGFFQFEATEHLLARLREGNSSGLFLRFIHDGWDKPIEVDVGDVGWRMEVERPHVEVQVDLPSDDDPTRHVAGQVVSRQDGRPILGVIVKAFDANLRSEEPLGERTTDERGTYRIPDPAEQFSQGDNDRADLIIRVFDSAGNELGASDVTYNAPAEAIIDLVVEPLPKTESSEYEHLVADITPHLEGVPLADLTDDHLAFLAAKTGVERNRLEELRQAAQISRQTDLPIEVLYAFARHDIPLDLKSLLSSDLDTLRGLLETSIKRRIIPNCQDRIRPRRMLDFHTGACRGRMAAEPQWHLSAD